MILTLALASIVRRYQEVMAERRMRIRRILRGVELLQDLIQRIDGCPLPAELQHVLRQDILERYRMVGQIDRHFEGIDVWIAEAEQSVNQVVETVRFEIHDKPQLLKITNALAELIGFLREGRLMSPLSAGRSKKLVELAVTRRAESVYRFHRERAVKCEKEKQLENALKHCTSIKAFLTEQGAVNPQIESWIEEADVMRDRYSEMLDASTPAA